MAALDNVGPVPSYRTQPHLASPQNKRYSRQYPDLGASVLSSSVYRSESPTENDYSTSRSGGPRIISPPPDSSWSNTSGYNLPTGGSSSSSKTPREGWRGSSSQAGSPGNVRVRQNAGHNHSYEKSIMDVDSVRKVQGVVPSPLHIGLPYCDAYCFILLELYQSDRRRRCYTCG